MSPSHCQHWSLSRPPPSQTLRVSITSYYSHHCHTWRSPFAIVEGLHQRKVKIGQQQQLAESTLPLLLAKGSARKPRTMAGTLAPSRSLRTPATLGTLVGSPCQRLTFYLSP